MRVQGKTVIMFATAVAVVSTVLAQGPGGRGRGFGGMMGGMNGYLLASNKSVQQELKLTDEQSEKVTKVASEIREQTKEKFGALKDLSREERREKGMAIGKENDEKAKTALKDILKPEQLARLHQIVLQQRGVEAFADSHVQDKLKLTDDQKSKLKELGENHRREMGEIFQSAQNDREGAREKIRTARKESLEKAVGVLTSDQKATWKELTGEPFEVKYEGQRRGAGA
jgi:Spy/CpxP family protein refolding chaperone